MESESEPVSEKEQLSGKEGWWSCLPCLKLNLCPTHAVVLSSAGAPGRAELQRRLAYAQAQVKKAEMKAASLKRALKRISVVARPPTLQISHAGWKDADGKGWAPGVLPVFLALHGAEDSALAATVAAALQGAKLELEGCSSGMFYARHVKLPESVIQTIPVRRDVEMRPGAVLYDPARHRLYMYTKRAPKTRPKNSNCRLLGFLLEAGLESLSYSHVPNGRIFADCVYCHRADDVGLPILDVTVERRPRTGQKVSIGKASASQEVKNVSASKI